MRINRFLVEFGKKNKKITVTDPDLLNQWRNVLRLEIGAMIKLFNGEGLEAIAVIETLTKTEANLRLDDVYKVESSTDREVILYCAVLKKENFELVAQKATEIGVKKIVPIITERTIKLGLNQDRLKKIVTEAAEQSGRADIPEINEVITFAEALTLSAENKKNYFFHFAPKKFKSPSKVEGPIGLFIGPEGGWSDGEVALAKQTECEVVSLGDNVLRGETAAIVASYVAVN